MRKNCVVVGVFGQHVSLANAAAPREPVHQGTSGVALGVVASSTNFSLPTTMILLNFASNQVVSGS